MLLGDLYLLDTHVILKDVDGSTIELTAHDAAARSTAGYSPTRRFSSRRCDARTSVPGEHANGKKKTRKTYMTELEERFVTLSKELQAKAKEAAEARRLLVMAYLDDEYAGIPYEVTIRDDNLNALDISFPGLPPDWSRNLIEDIMEYLRRLLDEGNNEEHSTEEQ